MLFWASGNGRLRKKVSLSGLASLSASGRWVRLLVLCVAAMMVAAVLLHSATAHAQEDFLDPKDAFVFSAAMVSPTQVDVHFKIAPKYYMYRERFGFALAPDAGLLGMPAYPKGTVKYDPTFERDLEVYHDQVTVRLPVAAGASQPLTLAITSQGCADAGLCYPPMTSEVKLTPTAAGYMLSGPGATGTVPAPRDEIVSPDADATNTPTGFGTALKLGDVGFASYLAQAGWMQIVALSLVLGVLLSFTPCVLPMVPILLAIIAGKNGTAPAGADARSRISRWRGLSLAAAYVLGMSLVYTVMGIGAGLIGASLAVWLQTPWVLSVFAVLLGLLALAMFDVFTLQAPTGMQSALNQKLAKIPGGHYSGAFVMGMVSALIVGPCVAAPLAGVLLFISQTGDLTLGGSALFAMAWGQGLLLLVVGATSGALLPKAGPWMNGIKRLFGILLLATAWWMVNSVLPAWVSMLGWAFLALWGAVMLGAFEP
ncbi:MAG TPA: protein-disulfide reductase DsbD, partial [Eoetvoesiella sp.]